MAPGLHFISGLPRSGSTLLSAILRQNPRLHAGMTSPVGSLVSAMLRHTSQENEAAVFIGDEQRQDILAGIFNAYYRKQLERQLVFDTNRLWCSKMPLLATLFPGCRVIACVRHVPWIVDSLERLVRKNKLEPSKIFNFDAGGTVYSRVEGLGTGNGMIGYAWNALREAFYGEESGRLMLLTYETLTTDPARALHAVYEFIGEPRFAHDFENIEFEAGEFDRRMGSKGLHTVGRAVRPQERATILPPDLFRRVEADSFWRDPAVNLRNVPIV
jgi:sulfotransferase